MVKKTSWSDGVKKLSAGKWLVRVTWTDKDGKRRDTERVVLADSKAEALLARTKVQAELSGPRLHGWTVATAFDRYVATLKPGTKHSWGSYARRIVKVFGDRRLGEITPTEIQRFLFQLPVSDATAAQYRTVFLRAYAFAQEAGEYPGTNPVRDTRPRKTPKTNEQLLEEQDNPVVRAYRGDETQRFLAALDPELRPLQITQLLLGSRFGEVSALELGDVDWVTGAVRIRRGQFHGAIGVTKAKKARPSGLGPYGLAMLKAHRARMEELKWPGWDRLVFPRPLYAQPRTHDMWAYWTVRTKVKEAQEAAGISIASRTHAMRHTNVTAAAVQRDMAMDTTMAALHRQMVGHASAAQSMTYIDTAALPVVRLAGELEKVLVPLLSETASNMGEKIRTAKLTG